MLTKCNVWILFNFFGYPEAFWTNCKNIYEAVKEIWT